MGVIAFDVGATDILSWLATQSLVDALNALFATLMPGDMFAPGAGCSGSVSSGIGVPEHPVKTRGRVIFRAAV